MSVLECLCEEKFIQNDLNKCGKCNGFVCEKCSVLSCKECNIKICGDCGCPCGGMFCHYFICYDCRITKTLLPDTDPEKLQEEEMWVCNYCVGGRVCSDGIGNFKTKAMLGLQDHMDCEDSGTDDVGDYSRTYDII